MWQGTRADTGAASQNDAFAALASTFSAGSSWWSCQRVFWCGVSEFQQTAGPRRFAKEY
jgi:hypothetical protein